MLLKILMKSWNSISRISALFSAKKTSHDFDCSLSSLPERICDVISPLVERSPDHLALVEGSGAWSYQQLAAAVSEAKAWLQDLGVRPGDRVMLVCENCRAAVAILLASAALDAWPVLVGTNLSARELDEIRNHCCPRRIIYFTTGSR